MPIDSLKYIIPATKISSEIDLVDKVSSFYNSAWDKLIEVGAVAFAIVGIIVPLAFQWYQKKTLKQSEELLKKVIAEESEKNKKDISDEINLIVNQKFEEYDKNIKLLGIAANANILLLQGKFNLEKNSYPTALSDFIAASFGFLECEEYQGLQKTLDFILNNCLPYLSHEDITDLKVSNDSDLLLLITQLKENDKKSIFLSTCNEIRFKMTKLPKNKPPKIVTQEEKPKDGGIAEAI